MWCGWYNILIQTLSYKNQFTFFALAIINMLEQKLYEIVVMEWKDCIFSIPCDG